MESEIRNINVIPSSDTKVPSQTRCRRPSFVDICQEASKLHSNGTQNESATDPVRNRKRSYSIPEWLPEKEPRTSEGCTSAMLPSCLAANTTSVPAAGESGRYDGCTDRGDCSGAFGVADEEQNRPQTATDATTGTDDAGAQSDEVAALRELVQRQKEDLEMAAMIGQGLLDSTEELSAKLEAAKEEKWLADCEKDALQRDLDHATQRCEQMQRDTAAIEVVPEPEEPQVEEFDLWSPGTNAAIAAARASISEDGGGNASPHSPFTTPTAATAAATTAMEDDKGADLLKKTVEKLEQANTTLKEKLLEARLEMTALRRTSVERGEAVLDQVTREFVEKEKKRASVNLRAPPDDIVCGRRVGNDSSSSSSDGEGDVCQDNREEARNQRPGIVVPGSTEDQKEPTPPPVDTVMYINSSSNNNNGEDYPLSREGKEEQQTGQDGEELAGPTDSSKEGKVGSRRTSDNSDSDGDDENKREIAAATGTSAAIISARRRLSSSAFRDAEEQAELIEALREQISDLREELKSTRRVSSVSASARSAGNRRRVGEPSSSSSVYPDRQDDDDDDDDAGQPRNRSKCSSDDDDDDSGGSDRGYDCCDGDGGIDRIRVNDDVDHGKQRCSSSSSCQQQQTPAGDDEGSTAVVSKGSGGDTGQRKKRGGPEDIDVNSGRDGNGGRVDNDDDRAQSVALQAQVDSLSAALEAGKLEFGALEQRWKQEQATCLELQREYLRLHGARENRTVMVAAVARGSTRAPAAASSAAAHTARHDPGGDSIGPGSERCSNCLTHPGLCWLQWFWRVVCCGKGEEGVSGNGFEDRSYDDTRIGERGRSYTAAVGGEVGEDDGGGVERGGCRNGQETTIRRRRRLLATDRQLLLTTKDRKNGVHK